MPRSERRKAPAEQPEELLDLPLDGTSRVGREALGPDFGDDGDVGSRKRRQPRRRAGWPWLVLLLAFPLGGLVGYLLASDPPAAALSTDLLDFGEVRLATTGSEQAIRVSNQGEQTLRPEAATLLGEAAGEFRIADDDCTGRQVAAGAGCAVRLAFAPAARGARRARLRLDSNAPEGPQSVLLIGVGTAPELMVEPTELDLGTQATGGDGAPATLRLGNRGTAPLQLGRIGLGGAAAADFQRLADGCSSRLLAPGERCSMSFAFAPNEAGERRAELSIESDAGAPGTVKLKGRGVLRSPILRLEPRSLGFGPVPVAGDGSRRTLKLVNDGDGPLSV